MEHFFDIKVISEPTALETIIKEIGLTSRTAKINAYTLASSETLTDILVNGVDSNANVNQIGLDQTFEPGKSQVTIIAFTEERKQYFCLLGGKGQILQYKDVLENNLKTLKSEKREYQNKQDTALLGYILMERKYVSSKEKLEELTAKLDDKAQVNEEVRKLQQLIEAHPKEVEQWKDIITEYKNNLDQCKRKVAALTSFCEKTEAAAGASYAVSEFVVETKANELLDLDVFISRAEALEINYKDKLEIYSQSNSTPEPGTCFVSLLYNGEVVNSGVEALKLREVTKDNLFRYSVEPFYSQYLYEKLVAERKDDTYVVRTPAITILNHTQQTKTIIHTRITYEDLGSTTDNPRIFYAHDDRDMEYNTNEIQLNKNQFAYRDSPEKYAFSVSASGGKLVFAGEVLTHLRGPDYQGKFTKKQFEDYEIKLRIIAGKMGVIRTAAAKSTGVLNLYYNLSTPCLNFKNNQETGITTITTKSVMYKKER